MNQSINQSTNQPTNQSINQPISQLINQPTNQSIIQSINLFVNGTETETVLDQNTSKSVKWLTLNGTKLSERHNNCSLENCLLMFSCARARYSGITPLIRNYPSLTPDKLRIDGTFKQQMAFFGHFRPNFMPILMKSAF